MLSFVYFPRKNVQKDFNNAVNISYFTIYNLTKLCTEAVYICQCKSVLPEDDRK